MSTNPAFWQALDTLVAQSKIIIDRPKGSAHPRYADFVYPLDYGYLKNTAAMDGEGIDIWLGSRPCGTVGAIMGSGQSAHLKKINNPERKLTFFSILSKMLFG